MTRVLQFWRDIEIFNIPDAPAPTRPGRPGAAPAQSLQAELLDYGIELPDAGAEPPRPRSRVVQRFSVTEFPPGGSAIPLLPWHDARFQDAAPPDEPPGPRTEGQALPAGFAHAVYVGVARKQSLVEFILQTHNIAASVDEQYRPASGDGWLAAFLVGPDGTPLKKTYAAASFAIGSCLLRTARSLDGVSGDLRDCSSEFDERMAERRQLLACDPDQTAPFALQWEDLLREWGLVHGLLQPDSATEPLAPRIVVESIPLYRRKDGSLNPPPEQAAAFLNSFYLDDLTALLQGGAENFSSALAQYLGPDSQAAQRQDLLSDPSALARHAPPSHMPRGRWPSPPAEHLALAQQTAVHQILARIGQADGVHSRGLMAVNGPPGTGKTTLLKEVIAEVVVQRAQRLSTLSNPAELFTGQAIQVDQGEQRARALRADLVAGSGIVVTSSNNAAVQNISFELPFSCDRGSFPHAAYLTEVATLVAEKFRIKRKHPWGLLSGALGAKANREKLATALMGYEPAVSADNPASFPQQGEPSSLKPWLDLARKGAQAGSAWRQRWDQARTDFVSRHAAVEALRAELVALHDAMEELPRVLQQSATLQDELQSLQTQADAMQREEAERRAGYTLQDGQEQASLQAVTDRLAAQQIHHQELTARLNEVRDLHDPGWLARKLKQFFGVETRTYSHWKQQVTQARAAIDAAGAKLQATQEEQARIAGRIDQRSREYEAYLRGYAHRMLAAAERTASLRQALEELAARAAALRARLAGAGAAYAIPDAQFLALPTREQHTRSLWVSPQLEQARSELFLSALRLHEAALMANAEAWFTLLRVVRGFLGGQSQPKTQADREAIWNALFFVVPVVSTTLASFGRLFEGMGQESLGWVLVDEAGQAPAAAVAGALWRARRAVMVGDPLQIEPIVTVPRALAEKLGAQRGMDSAAIAHWSPCVQSAQTIADRTMHLGAMVGDVWTGLPLRTHRRCLDPMFAVANRIAYDDQMVQATRPSKVAPDFHASCWIDVRGVSDGKLVQAEIDALRRILETFLDGWPQIVSDNGESRPASVYIISPFRDVAQACKDLVDGDASLGRKFARRKLVVDAGTVHTFQGKEASIVFMVLGSAPGAAGADSRSWAASKPNLLNVALTRAQQRFYIIGSHADWSGLPYFSELSEQAGHMPRMRIENVEGTRQVRLAPAAQTMPGSCIV